MRRFFSNPSIIALVLFACAAGAAPAAHAVECTYNPNQPTLTGGCTGGNICLPEGSCGTPPDTTTATGSTGGAQSTSATAATNKDANIVDNFEGGKAFAPVTNFIMSIFAWLLGVAMVVLDSAVYYTVVKMGDYINGLSAVGVTWRILRDIGNIALIFGFLAVGITTILNVDWYGGKKTLPMLIIVAVLLNFSLFISEAIIDSGNLFATQFYSQIRGGAAGDRSISSITDEPISNAIMDKLGLATLYGSALRKNDLLKENNIIFINILGGLLFMVAAFVMFSLAFILIARFVVLLFLIIIAPLGFAGLAVPQLKGAADKWWSELINQTITAPALLLLLYIALAIITDSHFLIGTGTPDVIGFVVNGNGELNLAGFASYLLSFIVAMGALLAVTMFAKQLGAFGASWATHTAGKLSFGATAWMGRTTLGWTANKGAKYLRGTAFGRVPLVGTGFVKGLDQVAKGSFDVRGAGVLKGLPFGGVDAGGAQKGGYKADLKERVESRVKYAKELTGRALTEEEKIDQKFTQDAIKAAEKRVAEAQVRQREFIAAGKDTRAVDEEIATEKKILSGYKTTLEKIEGVTDKGAQRKYASNLELGYLGLNEKSTFNKYLNFAANTEAAKKIRAEAKKSSDDKTLDALKKALKKASGEESSEGKKEDKKEEKKTEEKH